MRVYVLGAGASVHAGYPLARGLGDALVAWLPAAQSFVRDNYGSTLGSVHRLYGGLADLEQVLEDMDTAPAGSLAATLADSDRRRILTDLRHLIHAFFRSLRESPATLYERFARGRVRPGDVLVTFNYDVALERELKRAGLWEVGDGYGFDMGIEAMPKSATSLLKLHGSTNWLEILFGGMTQGFQQTYSNVFGSRPVVMRGEFEFLKYPAAIRDPLAPTQPCGAVPAIITPCRNKQFYEETSSGRELADFWDHLWNEAVSALEAASHIVVIGYSMPQADERARLLLLRHSNKDAQVEIYCGADTERVAENFLASGFSSVRIRSGHFFEDHLNAGLCRSSALSATT